MGIVAVGLVGQKGISVDIAPAELPPNVWSDGTNVRFYHGAVQTMFGDQELLPMTAQPTYAQSAQGSMAAPAVWVVAADDKVFSVHGNTLTDISATDANPSVPLPGELCWSGGNLGQLTILNDAHRTPWLWPDTELGTIMTQLPNWSEGMKCHTLRSFKQFLVALDVTKEDGTRYPTMVKWSHPADPGNPPPSWDETDPTKDAGETVLAETPGSCMDCVTLRDTNLIYKTDSVWGMQYIGGVFIFRFYKIFGDFGIPQRNCAVEYISGKHFCFTGTDLIIHDGNSARSIVEGRAKSRLRGINVDQIPTCYVVSHPAMSEVWFCWRRRTDGKQAADSAIVYNHLEDTVTFRDLPDYRFIATGRVDPKPNAIEVWDPNTEMWDNAGIVWSEFAQIPAFLRLLGLGDEKLNWVDGLNTIHSPFKLERTYVGIPVRADKPPDLSTMKFVRRVWPRFVGAKGTELQVTFGSADDVGDSIKWRNPILFVIGVTRKFDITLSGKVMAIRIESITPAMLKLAKAKDDAEGEHPFPTPVAEPTVVPTQTWRFNGMDIDVKPAGEM